MRTMKGIYTILYIIMAMVGCMSLIACAEQGEWMDDNSISLRAEVERVAPMSRSGNYAEPVADNNLRAMVWFSFDQDEYPEAEGSIDPETNIPGHYVIDFKGEEAAFPNVTNENMRPRYPIDNTPVYCVGFYPHEGWEGWNNNDSKVTHEITGFEDLMYAPPIIGSWNNHFDKHQFLHLLTWLKVCVCATTTEAGNYWGRLKRITLKDVPQELQINNLSKMQSDYGKKITSDDISPLKDTEGNSIIHSVDILNNDPGIDLGINLQDVGSIFCYPQSSYTIVVECENGETKEIEIDLNPLSGTIGFPAGYQYVITLNFHPFNVVEGVCTLQEWNAQNEELYPDAQQ